MKWLLPFLFVFTPVCLAEDYLKPVPGKKLEFPKDHASHPEYMTEWWYLTGQLVPKGEQLFQKKAAYGFQITFFRHKGDFLAHAALSDVAKQTFDFDRRVSPGSSGLGFMSDQVLSGYNQDYAIELIANTLIVTFNIKGKKLRLVSQGLPEILYHGENGFSRKSSFGTASYYTSLPRVKINGDILSEGKKEEVTGIGWFDHEFSSGTIAKDQTGWDWVSLMFKDGRNLMAFKVRGVTESGNYYSGTYVDREGHTKALNDILMVPTALTNLDDVSYPLHQKIVFEKEQVNIVPLLDKQLIRDKDGAKTTEYWEGAVSSEDGEAIGYLELTGYREPLRSEE